jgi:hypothetical protein
VVELCFVAPLKSKAECHAPALPLQLALPKGRVKIAQPLMAGWTFGNITSPVRNERIADDFLNLFRPCRDLIAAVDDDPAINGWAIGIL